ADRRVAVEDAVRLQKLLDTPRARRPLHLELVAAKARRIDLTRARPGVHGLAALLANRTEREEGPFELEARLLGELASRGGQWIFARFDLALGNGPGAE